MLGKTNEVRFIDLGKVTSSAASTFIQFIVNELSRVDEIQTGISPNLLVRNWPPAFREWSTKGVRDGFFASPLFPRLLNPEAVKETIASGVSNGQLAYVGKTANGKYLPFHFERTLNASDVEISEEMFVVTKDTAEAYRKELVRPEATTSIPSSPQPDGTAALQEAKVDLSQQEFDLSPQDSSSQARPQRQRELTWSGELPPQKWMNFYTKFLTKLGVGSGLTLSVKVFSKPEDGLTAQKMEELKNALRELGLNDGIE